MLDSSFTLARRHTPHLSMISFEQANSILGRCKLLIIRRVQHDFGEELEAGIPCKRQISSNFRIWLAVLVDELVE
jgi:hypothetical protein